MYGNSVAVCSYKEMFVFSEVTGDRSKMQTSYPGIIVQKSSRQDSSFQSKQHEMQNGTIAVLII